MVGKRLHELSSIVAALNSWKSLKTCQEWYFTPRWITSYLIDGSRFVMIDDNSSVRIKVTFGPPQGSILGPVLFNLYVNNLSEVVLPKGKSRQYANDTTIKIHCKPSIRASRQLQGCLLELQGALDKLSTWSSQCNLALNPKRPNLCCCLLPIILSRIQRLNAQSVSLRINDRELERVSTFRLLGTKIHPESVLER